MLNKTAFAGLLVIAGVLWGIAALSPITSQKYWRNFKEVSGLSQAAFLPMSDLPLRVLRAPALVDFKFNDRKSKSQRIDLNQFFGFEVRNLPDKDRFKIVLEEKEYIVRLKSVEKKGENYFTWIGTLDNNENHLLVLTFLNGYAGANINGPSGVYAIHFEHGRHMLKKFENPE